MPRSLAPRRNTGVRSPGSLDTHVPPTQNADEFGQRCVFGRFGLHVRDFVTFAASFRPPASALAGGRAIHRSFSRILRPAARMRRFCSASGIPIRFQYPSTIFVNSSAASRSRSSRSALLGFGLFMAEYELGFAPTAHLCAWNSCELDRNIPFFRASR